jgi:hypothetical protein
MPNKPLLSPAFTSRVPTPLIPTPSRHASRLVATFASLYDDPPRVPFSRCPRAPPSRHLFAVLSAAFCAFRHCVALRSSPGRVLRVPPPLP